MQAEIDTGRTSTISSAPSHRLPLAAPSMVLFSPHPPIVVPDVAFGEFVLRGAAPTPNGRQSWTAFRGGSSRSASWSIRCAALRRGSRAASAKVTSWRSGPPTCPSTRWPFTPRRGSAPSLTTVNPAYTNDEVTFQLRDSGARLLVTTAAFVSRGREAAATAALSLDIVTLDDAPGRGVARLDRDRRGAARRGHRSGHRRGRAARTRRGRRVCPRA